MTIMRTHSCDNPSLICVLVLPLLLLLLLLADSVTGRTVSISIPPCFGISSTVHTSELRSMQKGTAYTLKTPSEGILLNSNLPFKSTLLKACNYAFTLPTHPQYHSLTTFIKRFELNTTRTDGFVNLVFISGSKIVSNLLITKSSTPISNVYLDTKDWPRNETLIYMFLMHNLKNKTSTLHLDISLTPTYVCFLNTFKNMGSHVKRLNPINGTLSSLSKIFHPGWLLCTTAIKTQSLGYKVTHPYMAFCIDYRLSCDGVVNCPRSSTYSTKQMFFSNSLYSADESSADLVCYAPPINWFLITTVVFSIFNILILCLLAYVGVLRRYSPRQYVRLRNTCLRYLVFCLPVQLRYRVSASIPNPQRSGIDISSLELPISPPTYASVQQVEIHNQKNIKMLFTKRKNKSLIVPKSGNALPPSYSDAEDEVEVIPSVVIQRMHTLNEVRPSNSHRTRKTIFPVTKPLSNRYRRNRNARNLRAEFRILLRRMTNRRHNRQRNGQQNQVQQPSTSYQEQLPSQIIEESSAPPPNYNEFLIGDFPRFPEIVVIDYIRPPPSDRFRRIQYGHHRRH
ncbi:unnamed protein product [Rodentolepis nana]|uniref:Envelope glycoprotein O n=1 Tax=Rodentolepis nana TaxID=102285 RepID=A0A0R3TLC0_RODNA|nr:unnamed protein product [Rodentolepis nana]